MSADVHKSKRSLSPPPHDETNDSLEHEHQGRQRARAACAPCRHRKRKCDGRMPCATCIRYEYECKYSSTKRGLYTPSGNLYTQANNGTQESPQQPTAPDSSPHKSVTIQPRPLTAPGARFHHRGILDPTKARYVRANSAVAFPRILAMDLESETVPRLHSFAWNLGVRAEIPEHSFDITTLLSWADMQELATIYFKVVRREFGLLEEEDFMETAAARFANPHGDNDIDCVILGVAALGSFFSPNPHPREDDFITNAAGMLHTRSLIRAPNINMVIGWILRTIYQRHTSRPHAAWMSSSITMHQIEAGGLHKELQSITVVYPAVPTPDQKIAKRRRKVFWIARSLNVILSYEFGRSKVYFDKVTTQKFAPDGDTHAHQLVELACILPSDFVDPERDPDPPTALSTALTAIEQMKSDSAFINLLRADLAFAIYRRLWLMSLTDAKDRAETVMEIGQVALSASAHLLEQRLPWPNISGTPFQFLCVVIAISTPKSLALVPSILNHLHRITYTYDTHMVREAYNQALALANMARSRKERELRALSDVQGLVPFEDPPTGMSAGAVSDVLPNLDWNSMEMGQFDWDCFLNPELILSGQQDQGGLAGDASFAGLQAAGF